MQTDAQMEELFGKLTGPQKQALVVFALKLEEMMEECVTKAFQAEESLPMLNSVAQRFLFTLSLSLRGMAEACGVKYDAMLEREMMLQYKDHFERLMEKQKQEDEKQEAETKSGTSPSTS